MSSTYLAPVKNGDVLGGKYRVEKVLGAGGMGVVVAARHIELDTMVALKFMLPDALADRESVERFSREARAMVRLTSPHSARVFDVGKLPNGAPFMVMELLWGEDLGDLLDRTTTPLPLTVAVGWILEACVGLAEAHAQGIIHRDLKPRNIFLARQPDGSAIAKVLDFGLAKSVTAMGAAERALTRTSAMMGSPGYMSPEQMRAAPNVDAGTDIWSLGVCLYELLTKVLPFDAATIPELCALVLTSTPRPPEHLRPEIPAQLSATIMRCLERDRARRFRDIGELADALRSFAPSGAYATARARGFLDTASQRFALGGEVDRPSGPRAIKGDTKTEVVVDARREASRPGTIAAAIALGLVALAVSGVAVVRVAHRTTHVTQPFAPTAVPPEPPPTETNGAPAEPSPHASPPPAPPPPPPTAAPPAATSVTVARSAPSSQVPPSRPAPSTPAKVTPKADAEVPAPPPAAAPITTAF